MGNSEGTRGPSQGVQRAVSSGQRTCTATWPCGSAGVGGDLRAGRGGWRRVGPGRGASCRSVERSAAPRTEPRREDLVRILNSMAMSSRGKHILDRGAYPSPSDPRGWRGAAVLAEGQPFSPRRVGKPGAARGQGAHIRSPAAVPSSWLSLSSRSRLGLQLRSAFQPPSGCRSVGSPQPPAPTTLRPPRRRLLARSPPHSPPVAGNQAVARAAVLSRFPVSGWQGAGTWVSAKRRDRRQQPAGLSPPQPPGESGRAGVPHPSPAGLVPGLAFPGAHSFPQGATC